MIIPDANLLLYAYDSSSRFHDESRCWWERCLSGTENVGLCAAVVYAFVRIGTHPRVYEHPMAIETAAAHVGDWMERRNCRFVPVELVDINKSLKLLQAAGAGGDLTMDAQIAALAMRLGATIHSADTDFLRFSGLKLFNPLRR